MHIIHLYLLTVIVNIFFRFNRHARHERTETDGQTDRELLPGLGLGL